MRLLYFTLLTIVFIGLTCCGNSGGDPSKRYNKTFSTGRVPGVEDFLAMNAMEKQIIAPVDSARAKARQAADSVKRGNMLPPMALNRCRMYTREYRDGEITDLDTNYYHTGVPIMCRSYLQDDTVYVEPGMGIQMGTGIDLNIYKNEFASVYHKSTTGFGDDVLKRQKNDTGYAFDLALPSQYQSLSLLEAPKYKTGETLTGLLQYRSPDFYSDREVTHTWHSEGRMYFTCQLRNRQR